MNDKYYYSLGRRKTATATIRLYCSEGSSTFNGKSLSDAFKDSYYLNLIAEPFKVCNLNPNDFHFTIVAKGGGIHSQVQAARLALSRSLILMNPDLKKLLKTYKLTTRDSRMVESKKTGFKKARKKEQYSKR